MNTDIKQAMHVEAGKSFGTAEANENERRWNNDKIDRKNLDPTNHYDKTRMKLNFEIGPDGKVHPLGYQKKSLEVRLQERLTELGWKPFKPDSKIQPNCCAKFIFGGNHDRTLEMAFGTQTVNLDKDADNSHLQRCPEIEQWAKDVYDWCAKRYGQENIIGFQVHLDESSPHIHALIVPADNEPKADVNASCGRLSLARAVMGMAIFFGKCTPHYMKRLGAGTGWNVVTVLKAGTSVILVNAIISGNCPKMLNRRRKQSRGCRL